MSEIPRVGIAVLGGSTTIGAGFPEGFPGVEVLGEELVFETPFGPTAPFTHAKAHGKEFLYVDFHGITREIRNTQPNSSGERVFYVLWKAGVRKIIGTALCQAIGPGGRGGPRRLRGLHHQEASDVNG